MTTAATAAYQYRATDALPFYALKRRKAQKQRSFRAKSTYGHCIKDEVLIDPCMGSGHILVYAFDVLMQIYTSAGWSERDAAKSILENNLYGLDIDDRAGQLAYFAVMMKARKHSRRILNGEVKPNVLSIQDSNWMTDEFIAYVAGKDANMKADLVMLRKTFRDAKEYGSILNVPTMQYDALYERIDIINRSYAEDLFQAQYKVMAIEQLLPLVKQSQIMSRKYDVVVTNPPYMGNSGMSARLVEFVKSNYPDSKSDLFAVFIERCGQMIHHCGYQAMITQHAWMFLSSFENLRTKLLSMDTVNMAHLGARAFEEIAGEVVQTTSFVLRKSHVKDYSGIYCRLIEPNTQNGKEERFLSRRDRYVASQSSFIKIPGVPIAYWASQGVIDAFEKGIKVGCIGEPKQGMIPGNVDEFVRLWHEVDFSRIGFNHSRHEDINAYKFKWFPYNKGGSYRKWSGNISHLINMENDGYDIKFSGKNNNYRLREPELYFKEAITWSKVSTGMFSARYMPEGCLFDIAGCCVFFLGPRLEYVLAFMNSNVCDYILEMISPTINFEVEHIKSLPVVFDNNNQSVVNELSKRNIELSNEDWNSFETSWEFKKHPLL